MPRMFGDKLQAEITGADGGAIKTESQPIELTPELKAELHKINEISINMVKPEAIE